MNPASAADLIVTVHLLYVGFTVGGEILILPGGILRWKWVHNLPFRIAHLAAMALVAVEALAGVSCPLTVWEYALRQRAGQHVDSQISFVGRLIREIIFYNFPPWFFTILYVGFTLLVGLTLLLVPPRSKRAPPAA
ncbi:MAG TPA: DUF2784 domain-containing protein [Spirochaetia bacterium]|nr:DUF2784 domain-containing protein [Spirochaetia bacterium]